MRADAVSHWHGDSLGARLLVAYARHVPGHPFKIRWFRWMARRLFPLGTPIRSDAGVRLRVDAADYIGHEMCFSKAYEPASVALAARLMAGGGTFLDVGANFGLYTCPIAVLPGVRCIAVDASARALEKLRRNLALNPAANADVVTAALGAFRGVVRLETPVADNLGTTRVAESATGTTPRRDYVAAMPLDELLRELGVERIRLMKIDVEGYESTVFAGMDFQAAYRPDNIIMEYSDRIATEAPNLAACFALLSDNGYVPSSVTGEPFAGVLPLPEENLWWRHRDAP